MVYVKGGAFLMGATREQRKEDVIDDEFPVHEATLSDFYIGRYEVTQEEWFVVMGDRPSYFTGDRLPVEQVNWNDCQTFLDKLNVLTGLGFRLPTEAEWEYAARGGALTKGRRFPGSNKPSDAAWYLHNCKRPAREVGFDGDDLIHAVHEVGMKRPNELGLYDMAGNVWEWCADCYGPYSADAQTNPQGAEPGSWRPNGGDDSCLWHAARGGSWQNWPGRGRVSQRGYYPASLRASFIGLRLAR